MEQASSLEARLMGLRAEIAKGLEQARRGDLIDGKEVFSRLLAKGGRRKITREVPDQAMKSPLNTEEATS